MRVCTNMRSAKKINPPGILHFWTKIAVSKGFSLSTVMRISQSNNFIADLHGCTIGG